MNEKRQPLDWVLFLTLTCLWASAYVFNRISVNQDDPTAGLPPQMVIAGRLTIGAIVLLVAALVTRQKFPLLRDYRSWGAMLAMSIFGMAAPFFLITTAQKTVDSSLAALYNAAVPLFVAVMANYLFPDEKMSPRKAFGLVLGFSGIAVLFGPDAIRSFGSADATAQIFLIIATFFYALSTIIMRSSPVMPPIAFTAGYVCMAAVISWGGLVTVDFSSLSPSPMSVLSVVGLGIFPTALASLLYTQLIKRTNATFLSLTGYTIPVLTAIAGFLLFGETQNWLSALAFALILSGVWIAQHSGRKIRQ